MKSFLAHMYGFAPTAAQIGHEPAEKNTQDLIIAYAVENAEVAMYEALAAAAAQAGDMETERLARDIQAEEKATAGKVWEMIDRSARGALREVEGGKIRAGGGGA